MKLQKNSCGSLLQLPQLSAFWEASEGPQAL